MTTERYRITWFDVLDSTNSYLARLEKRPDDRSVVAARFQTAGRGQRGNRWESGEGLNLTFSILLRPEAVSAARQFLISQATALGTAAFLERYGIRAHIKWPNDIYVGEKKICGILIENTLAADKVAESIIGIGLNLNQEHFDARLANPTSLLLESGRREQPEKVLPLLLENLEARFLQLGPAGAEEVLQKEYLERLYRLGTWHRYLDCRGNADRLTPSTEIIGGTPFRGCIRGVDERAGLIVEDESGTLHTFAFKEIRYLE